ncbi:MAG: HAMP domain-containing histidine kinase [Elusimicrobia bacterium]|nr:HAMP domain-containing histidine kinase [Elusimicrobiota bacterium]
MESTILVGLAALAAGLGLGWAFFGRRGPDPERPVHDEERLAWLQRLSTVGQMMSGVVHEVRTPLNTVILTVEHAQRVLDRGGDPREYLARVSREADRAVEILSDILDFAKPSPLDLKPLALAPALSAALDPLKIRFDERGVETTLDAPEGLRVMASERHFHQVLTILLINALDALPFGGRLSLKAAAEDGTVKVYLTDSGVGIEPATLKRLFEPFATGRAESGGTGLGLNVARWIMNKHGGDVAIASEGIGKGTTVTLTLKAAPAAS